MVSPRLKFYELTKSELASPLNLMCRCPGPS
jgi:hypothetical protein